mmetsp:Transcript_30999/g.73912  ORF Transcript_30999/g.73912 Transcript_30999/m.73912 type:complete len:514 (+) Transcript_30999:38-1579(+)
MPRPSLTLLFLGWCCSTSASAFQTESRADAAGRVGRVILAGRVTPRPPRPTTTARLDRLRSSAAGPVDGAIPPAMADADAQPASSKRPFRIRTITAFVRLDGSDMLEESKSLERKIGACNAALRSLETSLTEIGFEVQTVRIATNPFAEWLTREGPDGDGEGPPPAKRAKDDMPGVIKSRLSRIDALLEAHGIQFFSFGPSHDPDDTRRVCPAIVAASGRFCCSANVDADDVESARAAAACIREVSTMDGAAHLSGGLGNFRFCAASRVESVPFFPGGRAPAGLPGGVVGVAVGLENGAFMRALLGEAGSVVNVRGTLHSRLGEELAPIQEVCRGCKPRGDDGDVTVKFFGIDTSWNPSLDEGGSVAAALEALEEVRGAFGGTGSLAAAAAVTRAIQSVPGIASTGYSGLMLPVLEDRRLAELANSGGDAGEGLSIQQLLCISSVCGVGIDTVPVPGDVSVDRLSSLILDVAALAGRWNKPLSCRVFPVPGGKAGDLTTFDSPYMCNSRVFEV